METNSLLEEKNLFETDENREEKAKLRLEAADLRHRLVKIKNRQMELTNQEKKKKMKESTPPPLKERKEIRKEDCYNNYNDNKGDSPNSKNGNASEQFFAPPTLDEVQAYMDEIGECRFTALKFWNYYEARGWILGKTKMRFWKRVLDNWVSTENDRARRRRGAKAPTAQRNIVTFNAYKPVDTTGAISILEYERLKKEGKL